MTKTRAWILVTCFISACAAAAVPLYSGPELDQQDVAEVSLPDVVLTAVRDNTGHELIRRHMKDARIALRPGRYQIEFFATRVVWSDLNFPIDTDLYTVDFTAVRGHAYVLRTRVTGAMRGHRRHLGDKRPMLDDGCCDPTATEVESSMVDLTTTSKTGEGRLVEINSNGERVDPVGPPSPPNN